MSTDLHHQLPNLRTSAVNSDDDVPSPPSDQIPDLADNKSSTITQPKIEIKNKKENDGAAVGNGENNESYRTPTSKESKIKEIINCPPAPKKPKAFGSCKRKLIDEFQFFDVSSNSEDMDAFFRSTFPKKTCPSLGRPRRSCPGPLHRAQIFLESHNFK